MFGGPAELSNEDRWERNLRHTLRFLLGWLAISLAILFICGVIPFVEEPDLDGLSKGLSFCVTVVCSRWPLEGSAGW